MSEITTVEQDREQAITNLVEVARCACDPVYFATKYAYIQNQNTSTIDKWEMWPYLVDLIRIIEKYDVVYILKASQLGISWLMALLNLWTVLFNSTAKCLLLSQGQEEAKDLLKKVNFIHANLPKHLKIPTAKDSRTEMSFKNEMTEILALPSTQKAGHGFQGTLITRDEVARHEHARENFTAVARAGGKLVELSTANKQDDNNYFGQKTSDYYYAQNTVKKVFDSGLELFTNPDMPDTCMIFLAWDLRPVRKDGLSLEDWWRRSVLPKYTALQIEEQYPSTIEDVFKASISLGYFDFEALDDMGHDVCPPIKQTDIDTMNGMVRVYKLPVPGRTYCSYTDPSNGTDPFVTMIMDFVTGEVVCSATGKERVGLVAILHDRLVRIYNNAYNSYEFNSVGIAFADRIVDMKTPNQAPRRKTDGTIDPEKQGQYMSGVSKKLMFGDLAGAISHRRFVCHDREFIQQAKLVQKGIKNGELVQVTPINKPFDWVMCMIGLWMLNKYVPRQEGSMVSYYPDSSGRYIATRRRQSFANAN